MRMLTVGLLLLSSCRDTLKESGLDETDSPNDTQAGAIDADGDGFVARDDCDDSDSNIYPGAIERCDEVDNDCDGLLDDEDPEVIDADTWYLDFDQDGFGGDQLTLEACEQPNGYVDNHQDCQDADEDVHPDAEEVCDGVDNDCDGVTDGPESADALTWYSDGDGDGYGTFDSTLTACDPPAGFALHDGDCDDADPAYHPGALESDCADPNDYNCDGSVGFDDADSDGFAACEDCDDSDANANDDAAETCDGVDNDCDGLVDSDDPDTTGTLTWYADADGDGYGGQQFEIEACEAAPGYVATNDDCDDLDPNSYPGGAEVCDDADNDCDSDVDEGVGTAWYADADGDGYGDATSLTEACEAPAGFVANGNDCDDSSASTSPASFEICDTVDNDCDGSVDEEAINATAFYVDADADGYGSAASSTTACDAPTGYADNDSDCNDADPAVNPVATEVCDGTDNDCDGGTDGSDAADAISWYQDLDADGFGNAANQTTACNQPTGYVADATDCNDTSASTNTSGTELCDLVDNDCDGTVDEDDASDAQTWYQDSDSDGYGTVNSTATACSVPAGFSVLSSDCDDTAASINPGATEVCDSVDNDCDTIVDEDDASNTSTWYQDLDADGYGNPSSLTSACAQPTGYVSDNSDCNDTAFAVNPGVTETWYDGVDADCAGDNDNDADADGAESYQDAGGTDCDDSSASVTACGSTSGTALSSCNALLTVDSSLGDANYFIDPDDDGDTSNAFEVYCDMTTNGGGWTLVANVAPVDGNVLGYPSTFWYSEQEYGSLGNRFSHDYRSPAAYLLDGTHLMIQSVDTGASGAIRGWKRWPFNGSRSFDDLFYDGTQIPHSSGGSMYSCDTQNSDASDTGTTSQWDGIIRKGDCLYADVNTESNHDVSRLVSSLGNITSAVSNRMGGFGTYIDNAAPGIDRGECGPEASTRYGGACHWSECAEAGTENPDCDGSYCTHHLCEDHVADFTWNSRFYVR